MFSVRATVPRLAPPESVNLPAAVLVLKPSMALALLWLTIFAVLLPSVMLAALVTMLAPLNWSVPLTL